MTGQSISPTGRRVHGRLTFAFAVLLSVTSGGLSQADRRPVTDTSQAVAGCWSSSAEVQRRIDFAACWSSKARSSAVRRDASVRATPDSPICADQVSALNSHCERWSRSLNDRGPDRAPVNDSTGGVAVNRAGSRLYVASTSTVGAARPHITVAALNANSGATLWIAHPRSALATHSKVVGLSPDQKTVVVLGYEEFAAGLNGNAGWRLLVATFDAATGHEKWTQAYVSGGSDYPVALQFAPKSDRIFVTGDTSYETGARAYSQWATVAYDLSRGRQLWSARYRGQQGDGVNQPVSISLSPRGDRVYVAGASEHPQNTGQHVYDFAAVAYDSRNGRPLWTTLSHVGSDNRPYAAKISPAGDMLYVTGGATFGPDTSPTVGVSTIALATATGHRLWAAKSTATHGSVAVGIGLVTAEGRVIVAALSDQQGAITPGNPADPTTSEATSVLAYDGRTGHTSWMRSFQPEPRYAVEPTVIVANSSGSMIYVTGVMGPPGLIGYYTFTLGMTATGTQSWVARSDISSPLHAGANLALYAYPNVPTGAVVDHSTGGVYTVANYYPAATAASSAECAETHYLGVPQPCEAPMQAVLVTAYGA
jgi:hypothetical protein